MGTERHELLYGLIWRLYFKRLWFQNKYERCTFQSQALLLCVLRLPVLCRNLHPCQIMHPLVEIATWLPNPNPTPNPNPSPTPNPKPTNTRGCIIWQGAEFGRTPGNRYILRLWKRNLLPENEFAFFNEPVCYFCNIFLNVNLWIGKKLMHYKNLNN